MRASLPECFPDPLTPAWPLTSSPVNCEARQIYALTAIACCIPGAHVLLLHEQENAESLRSCISKEFRFFDFSIEPNTTLEQITNFLLMTSEASWIGRGARSYLGAVTRSGIPGTVSFHRNSGGLAGGLGSGGLPVSTASAVHTEGGTSGSHTSAGGMKGPPSVPLPPPSASDLVTSHLSLSIPSALDVEQPLKATSPTRQGKGSGFATPSVAPQESGTGIISIPAVPLSKKNRSNAIGMGSVDTTTITKAKSFQSGSAFGLTVSSEGAKAAPQTVVACIRGAHAASPAVLQAIMDAVSVGQVHHGAFPPASMGPLHPATGRRERSSTGAVPGAGFSDNSFFGSSGGVEEFHAGSRSTSFSPPAQSRVTDMSGAVEMGAGTAPSFEDHVSSSLLSLTGSPLPQPTSYTLSPSVHIVLSCSQKCYTELLSESDRAAFALSACISALNVNQLGMLYTLNLRHSSIVNKKRLQELLSYPDALDTVGVSAVVSGYLRHLLLVIRGSALPGNTVGGYVMRHPDRYLRLLRAAAVLFDHGLELLSSAGARPPPVPSSSPSSSSFAGGSPSLHDGSSASSPVRLNTMEGMGSARRHPVVGSSTSGKSTLDSSADSSPEANATLHFRHPSADRPSSLALFASRSGVRRPNFADVIVTPTDVLCLLCPMIAHFFTIRVAQLRFLFQTALASSFPSFPSSPFHFSRDVVSSSFISMTGVSSSHLLPFRPSPQSGAFAPSHLFPKKREPFAPLHDGPTAASPPAPSTSFIPGAGSRSSSQGSFPRDANVRDRYPGGSGASNSGLRGGEGESLTKEEEEDEDGSHSPGGGAQSTDLLKGTLSFVPPERRRLEDPFHSPAGATNAAQNRRKVLWEMNAAFPPHPPTGMGGTTATGPAALSYSEVREFLRYVIIKYSRPAPG